MAAGCETVKSACRLLYILVFPFAVALCLSNSWKWRGEGHILKYHCCLSELTLFVAEEKYLIRRRNGHAPKEKKLRIFESGRPFEMNHVKHLKERETKFKIKIDCILETFQYHHVSD